MLSAIRIVMTILPIMFRITKNVMIGRSTATATAVAMIGSGWKCRTCFTRFEGFASFTTGVVGPVLVCVGGRGDSVDCETTEETTEFSSNESLRW